MRNIKSCLTIALVLTCAASALAEGPKTATAVLDGAMKSAKESKKPIWLIFDASW